MGKQIKVSVIIPVYNAEHFLAHCLNSLLEQGIQEEEYEIICVNDGSQDASLSILMEYARSHSNITVIDKENGGVSTARNRGLDVAQGKYVWFIDADDWVAKGFLGTKAIAEILNEEHMHIPLLLTKCINVQNSELEYYAANVMDGSKLRLEETRPFMTTARGHLFNRELIIKNNLRFDTNLSYGEDLMFMREFLDVVRFENESGCNYKMLQCQGANVYYYRIHSSSVMGQMRSRIERVADSILYRAKCCLNRYKMEDKPSWYRANYQEYVNLFMQEYMIYYFPALRKSMHTHLKELKRDGLYPSPPPKLGWVREKSLTRRVQQFAFKHSAIYPLYYMIMRMKFKKAGTV